MTIVEHRPLAHLRALAIGVLDRRPLALVAGAATLVLGLYLAGTANDVAFQIPTVDSATYHSQALAIASGKAPPAEPFWQAPLYPYSLAVLYALGIRDLTAVRAVHGLAMVAAAVLTVLLARRLVSRRLAVLAGLGVALYGPLLFYATQLLPAGLAVLLGLVGLLASLRVLERPSLSRAVLAGLAWGLAALAVPTLLVGALVPLAWLARAAWQAWRRGTPSPPAAGAPARYARLALALGAGVLLCILPVTIRNRIVSGEWVAISSNGGINLYIGNSDDLAISLSARPGQDWERLVALPRRHGAETAGESQAFFVREALHTAASAPGACLRRLAYKAWLVADAREQPRNMNLYDFREFSAVLSVLAWRLPGFAFPFGLAGPLALLGALRLCGTGRVARAILLTVGLEALMLVLFFPAARYRVPLVPVAVTLAVAGAGVLAARWREGQRLWSVVALLGALVLVNWPRALPTDGVNFAAELHANLGVGLQTRGRLDDALREYDRALRIDTRYADAWYYRGTALRAQNNRAGARLAFQSAIASRPNHARALHDLGVFECEEGRVELGAQLIRRSLAANPFNALALNNLAVAELRLGHADVSQALLVRARGVRESQQESPP